jgi:hypothetical protein
MGAYFIVLWNVKRRLKGKRVDVSALDVLDLHTADIRFIQAEKHGKVLTPFFFIGTRFVPRLHIVAELRLAVGADILAEDNRQEGPSQVVIHRDHPITVPILIETKPVWDPMLSSLTPKL